MTLFSILNMQRKRCWNGNNSVSCCEIYLVMVKLYTQKEAATLLGFQHYRSLNKLIVQGKLECIKRPGRTGRKLFSREHIENFIKKCEI